MALHDLKKQAAKVLAGVKTQKEKKEAGALTDELWKKIKEFRSPKTTYDSEEELRNNLKDSNIPELAFMQYLNLTQGTSMKDTTVTGEKGWGRNDPQYRNVGPMTLASANKYKAEPEKIKPIPQKIEGIIPAKKVIPGTPIRTTFPSEIYKRAKQKIKKARKPRRGKGTFIGVGKDFIGTGAQ